MVSGMMSKAALVKKLSKGLTWNDFQREAVLAGYPNGNAMLGDAWRYYRNPNSVSAAPPVMSSSLTPNQRTSVLKLSQRTKDLVWNDFQTQNVIKSMFLNVDGLAVNKNALMAAAWQQYKAFINPAAAAAAAAAKAAQKPRAASPLKREKKQVKFAAGDKMVSTQAIRRRLPRPDLC